MESPFLQDEHEQCREPTCMRGRAGEPCWPWCDLLVGLSLCSLGDVQCLVTTNTPQLPGAACYLGYFFLFFELELRAFLMLSMPLSVSVYGP